MAPKCCPETSVTKCQYTLRNMPEERRPHLHRDRNHKPNLFYVLEEIRTTHPQITCLQKVGTSADLLIPLNLSLYEIFA
jgi:hypothetical protein